MLTKNIFEVDNMDRKKAFKIWEDAKRDPRPLYKLADELRKRYFGNKVELCSIINAKSGNCRENCKFCAQSAYYKAGAPVYPLVSGDKMLDAAKIAAKNKAHGFGIV